VQRRGVGFVGSLAVLAAFVALFTALAGPLSRALVAGTIDLATGYRVAFDSLDLRGDRATATGVTLARGGEVLLQADRIAVRYRLRDLFPGGTQRYGLQSVALDRPRITLVRHADGSFNLSTRSAGPVPQAPVGAGAVTLVPLHFAATIRNGRISLDDRFRVLPQSRRFVIAALAGSVAIDTGAQSAYHLRGFLADPSQPVALDGRFDAGFALHRLRGKALALAPEINYFIDGFDARFERATARRADVRLYGFAPRPGGPIAYHLGGAVELVEGTMHVPGLKPLARGMTGRIDLFDGGLAAPALKARLGQLDVRIAGGLLDWRHLEFRLGLAAPRTTLEAVRRLFAFSHDVPLRGRARLTTLLEGPVGVPLVATHVTAAAFAFDVFAATALDARAIYYRNAVDVVGLRATYGGLATTANGAIDLGTPARSQLVVSVAGSSAAVPYLAEFATGTAVHATALVRGPDLRLDARGIVEGRGGGAALAGRFAVDARGDGELGPFALARPDGSSLAGTYYLDRQASRSGFWLAAHDVPYADLARTARLPGVDLAAPEFGGRVDGDLAGAGPPSDFRVAGRIGGRALHIGGVGLASARGDVLGRLGDLRLGNVVAQGPWGAFAGQGTYARDGLALAGAYRGSFGQLMTLTGNLGGNGPVAGPVSLLVDPRRMIVQTSGAVTAGSEIHGIPVDRLAGTVAVRGTRVRVYAASGTVAGGTLVAAGTLDGPRSLGLSAGNLAGARLHALVPLEGDGRVDAIGVYGQVGRAARFEGGIALAPGGILDRLPIAGNGDLTLLGNGLRFWTTDARFGPAFGSLTGRLGALGSREPTYDTHVRLAATPLEPFVRIALPGRTDIAGTVVGNVRIFGTGPAIALSGPLGVPEAEFNGLSIRDAAADVSLASTGLAARRGRVTVGSTRVAFGAAVSGSEMFLRLDALQADLADFNDFFDAGDTLGGRGRIAAEFRRHGSAVRSSADIAIARFAVRRFDLGDATARWHSRNASVTGAIAFGGTSGRLETAGTLGLATRAPLDKLLQRSRFDGSARLRGLDLGVWLPALGLGSQLPVLGRVDADATIAGPLRNPSVRSDAALHGGSIGAFPVDRLVLAASSTLSHTTVTRAELELPAVSLSGSGRFGFGPNDPIAFAIHAKSPDVAALAARLAKPGTEVRGAAEVDLKVDGTRARPRLAGGFDLEAASLHGVQIPRALGQFNLRGRDVVLSSVEVGFATGTLLFAGSVPLQISPVGLGPPAAPIALELAARGIDLADFKPLLPAGSELHGSLNGRVAIGGTAGAPRLNGTLALAGGAFASPFETNALTDLGAVLSFAGNDATLEAFHASAGGGTLDASGSATFPDLVRPGADATYRIIAQAKRLRLKLPAYGSGQIDGRLEVAHRPQRLPTVGGKLALTDATIPFAALLFADSGSGSFGEAPAAKPPAFAANPVALDLTVSAANNVRVRSSNVDIGGRGDLHIAGTSATPRLTGGFTSTGGTLTYVNTVFRIVDGRVNFTPESGLVPELEARATTHVSNPDPNTVRNLAGTADVTLDVTGPVTNLGIALSSDPAYDRQQILGLLLGAPALGASNLFGGTSGAPTLYGSTTYAAAPPGYVATRSSSAQFSVAQEAFGIANAQFTRTLLAPIESSFAQAVGLSNFNVNVDLSGAVGVTARKVLGKKLNAVYGTSFGYPYRQTFGFEIKPSESTAALVTVFQTLGYSGVSSLTPPAYQAGNLKLQAAQPGAGTVGFSLSLQRLFK